MIQEWSGQRIWIRAGMMSLTGIALLALLLWWVNPMRVASVLRNADLKWLGFMLIALTAATVVGAANSYLMAIRGSSLNFRSFLAAYWCAWALGQLIPGQVGDLIGVSLFLRRRGMALPTAVGRLGADKLISLFCLFALSGGLMAIYNTFAPRLAGFFGICAMSTLFVTYLLSLRWNTVSLSNAGLSGKFMRVLSEAHLVVKTRPLVVVVNVALTFFKLFLIGLCYWATFRAFHISTVGLIDITVTANSAGLVAYVPISANGVGTVEASAMYLFGLLGFAPPIVFAAYLTLRLASLLLAFGGAAIVLFFGAIFAYPRNR